MRRLTWVVLVVLLVTMSGGPALAQADKCAAEKKAVAEAETSLWKATELWLAAVDDMADAYGELTAATTKANGLAQELKTASGICAAAWTVFKTCRKNTPDSMCEKEYQAAKKAESEVTRLQSESSDANVAMGAAQIVLDLAKARVRETGKTMTAAEDVLDKARIALGKCMRRMV